MLQGRRSVVWLVAPLLLFAVGAIAAGVWPLVARSRMPVAASPESQAPSRAAESAPSTLPAPVELPARILARGDLDFPFIAYETFGAGRIALAAPGADGRVDVLVAEFRNGDLDHISRVKEPMGEVQDLTRGTLLNNGEVQAVITTTKGLLILLGTERYVRQDEAGLVRAFVGDWDNDGQSETAFLEEQAGTRQVSLLRYNPSGDGTKLGSFPAPDFPEWSAVLDRPGKPSLLMGGEFGEASLQVTFYSLDAATGLQAVAHYPIRAVDSKRIVSFTAGDLGDRPTLALSAVGPRSYLELFDTAAEGMPSRGRITLPDGEAYVVLAGRFTGEARSELLAITPEGRWILYGLD